MHVRIVAALLAVPLLAACASVPQPKVGKSTSRQQPIIGVPPGPPPQQPGRTVMSVPASPTGFRGARVMSLPGLEGVIGATESALTRQFGTPRLNVKEGDARKLQFSGTACVMDVYLYPLQPNAEPTATYVDARRASDGLDVDRASCAAALKR